MYIKEDSHIVIIRYSGTHGISQSHMTPGKRGPYWLCLMTSCLENIKAWHSFGFILYSRNHTVTRFGLRYLRARCGFRSGTWTMGPFWCFGSWRKKSLVLLWVLRLLTLKGDFSKTVRFPKVPGIVCSLKCLLISCQYVFFYHWGYFGANSQVQWNRSFKSWGLALIPDAQSIFLVGTEWSRRRAQLWCKGRGSYDHTKEQACNLNFQIWVIPYLSN